MPGQLIHADVDAYGYCYDGLQVGIHAYECGADALLAYGNEEVGDECGAYDEEGEFGEVCGGELTGVECCQFGCSPRQGEECGEEEYPLCEGDD